jgi:hypothetical protein
VPCRLAALTASTVTSAVEAESAAKIPPVWNQRTPSFPKMWSQSKSPGLSCDGAADAEAALGEIEAVADGAADAVVLAPLDEVGRDAALHDEVLDEVPDLVVDEGGADGRFQAEAFAEAAGGVVLAAALPDLEFAGGADATLAGIEAEHDFTERELVESAVFGGFDFKAHGREKGRGGIRSRPGPGRTRPPRRPGSTRRNTTSARP